MNTLLPVAAGFVIGLLIGLTGMGGGSLTTPFLIVVMKINPLLAIGTDLSFAAITKVMGGIHHYRAANVKLRHVAWMACGSLPTTLMSARLAVLTSRSTTGEELLPHILGAVLICVAFVFFARVSGHLAVHQPHTIRLPGPSSLVVIGAVGGFLVGLTSVGGGTIIMALLVIFFAMPISQMIGLDVVHGAVLTAVAALAYIAAGQTDWSMVARLLLGSLPGVWLGVHLVNRIAVRLASAIVGLLILGIGLHLLISGASA